MVQREGGSGGSVGVRWECDGAGKKRDVLACRMKRLARKLSGNGGITHHVHGRPLGTLREEQGKEGAEHETAARYGGTQTEPKMVRKCMHVRGREAF